MPVGFSFNCVLCVALFYFIGISAEWKLNCYDEELSINCESGSKIVIHDAQFGFFEKSSARLPLNDSCVLLQQGDCWTDVSTYISGLCSGQGHCETNVHYSIGLSSAAITEACSPAPSSKPSLFVEFDCISHTLFTKISSESHANFDQIGGYLTTLDYSESTHGGSEWRGHLAEAMCQAGREQLPTRFYLPAPTPYGQQNAVTFVLRIKDISLTYPANHTDPTGVLPGAYHLSAELDCLVRGKPCHQDYLEISAKLPVSSRPSVADEVAAGDPTTTAELMLPIARFCLVHRSGINDTPAASRSGLAAGQSGGEYLFGHGSPLVVGRVYGPLPPAVGLQFTSNLNLLDVDPNHTVLGKGILIEYIALFCTPITQPAGHGLVDYRFHSHPHSTVAYAEIFCPSDRWLEPQPPSPAPAAAIPGDGSDTRSSWWLERKRHTTHVCDHHLKSWMPNRIPAACLTDSELSAFVANVEMLMQKEALNSLIPSNTSVEPPIKAAPLPQNQTAFAEPAVAEEDQAFTSAVEEGGLKVPILLSPSKLHSGSSAAIGAAFGFLLCLIVVFLIVYGLRRRLVAHYHKTVSSSLPSMSHGLTRSTSTFNPSLHGYYPTVNSTDWRRKLGKSRWDFLKPWSAHTWSQNLSGTYPDLPRQTASRGAVSTGQKTPETMVIRSGSMPFWRMSMTNSNGQSSFSLVPGGLPPTPGMDSSAPNGSPWLRTTSTTQLNHHHNHQQPVYMNSLSEIPTPIDGYPFNQSWWLPWRRSLKKQRRIHMHWQRRREAQHQSQRKLMESSISSNGLSSQLALEPSTLALLNSSYHDSSTEQGSAFPNPDRPLSQRTTRSSRTFTTSDGGTATPGGTDNGTAAKLQHAPFSKAQAAQLGYTNWDLSNGGLFQSTSQPYQEVEPGADRQSSTGGGDTLPWKTTPPPANTFSSGLRRFSSFLRNLNGSLTPPRSSTRRSQPELINQIHPQSMSTLDHFQPSPTNTTGQSTASTATGQLLCFPASPVSGGRRASPGFPRAKSESGSVRLGRGILGLRSLFNIPTPRDSEGNASLYNLDAEESSCVGDLLSASSTTTTTNNNTMQKNTGIPTTTTMMMMMPMPVTTLTGVRPEDWAALYSHWGAPRVSETSATVPGHAPFGYSPMATYHHHHNRQQFPVQPAVLQPISGPPLNVVPITHGSNWSEKVPGIENPHCNDPYLEPVTLKRLRTEGANRQKPPPPCSDSDAQPSATSSAISSLVFADSMADDELEPDGSSATPVSIAPNAVPSVVTSGSDHSVANPFATSASRDGIDYVTYDLTRSGSTVIAPASRAFRGSPTAGELLATQLEVSASRDNLLESTPNRRPKRNTNQEGAERTSRPLSDAMISNHYYDANEPGFYPGTSNPVAPPPPPPRVDLMVPRQTAPNLPPLWSNSPRALSTGHSRLGAHAARAEFGSTDSLYETVDQFHGLGATASEQHARGRQPNPFAMTTNPQPSPSTAWFPQDNVTQRQRMALPPTPGSMDSVRAPMATGDDEVSDAE